MWKNIYVYTNFYTWLIVFLLYGKKMEIILDASAIIDVIADEPEAQIVINCIPRVKLNITTQEIVKILQECREGLQEAKNDT